MFGTERLVCGLCVRYPDLLDRHIERIAALGFADELHARFRDELCRVATDLDATSVADFFESLDERFYQILSEVMAAKPESNGSPPARAGFSDLLQRFPLLRNDPPEDFVEAVFLHFLDGLELRALERELQQELGGEDDVDEEAWNRIRGLSQDLARRREECAREEAALAEWAKKLRSPQGVGATAPDSLVSAS